MRDVVARKTSWWHDRTRSPAPGLFIPRIVTWDPEPGKFTRLGWPRGFATWEEAEEAGRFLAFQGERN